MITPSLAAANIRSGFYICDAGVFYVNAAGWSFQLRSREIPAMLMPARVPRCQRLEDCDDPVVALLAETADALPGALEPGIYRSGEDLVICVSQQLFSLVDGSLLPALPHAAMRLEGDDLEAVEHNHNEVISKIRRRLSGRILRRV